MPADLTDTQGYVCPETLKSTRARFEVVYEAIISLVLLSHFILLHHKKEESKTVLPFFYNNEDLLVPAAAPLSSFVLNLALSPSFYLRGCHGLGNRSQLNELPFGNGRAVV